MSNSHAISHNLLSQSTGHYLPKVSAFLAKSMSRISLMYRRHKVRQELTNLPLFIREDIGLTIADIEKIVDDVR